MSKSGRPSRGRRLSPEDEELWAAVSKSVKPVRKRDRVHRAVEEGPPPRPISDEQAKPLSGSVQRTEPASPRSPTQPPGTKSKAEAIPTVGDLDRRRARKIATGRVEIEARLDLHGMYQSEAHARLRSFILGCYSRG